MHVAVEVGVHARGKTGPAHQLDKPLLDSAHKAARRGEEVAGGGIALEGAGRDVGGNIGVIGVCGEGFVELRLQPRQLTAGILRYGFQLRGIVVVVQVGVQHDQPKTIFYVPERSFMHLTVSC